MNAAPSLLVRCWRHLWMTPWWLRRKFPEPALTAIADAVRRSEQLHGGEIRIAIEGDLPLSFLLRRHSARQRAHEVFASLGVWDTAQRNGVLIYLCLADRDVEIVADRGLSGIAADEWQQVCSAMERAAANHDYQAALTQAIEAVGRLIARHFPAADRNEQSDRPVLL